MPGIQTVPCHVATPRMNAIAERRITDADASSWTAPSSGIRPIPWRILRQYETPPQSAPAAPIPARRRAAETATQPINLDHYRVRKQAHGGGLINEYRLVA